MRRPRLTGTTCCCPQARLQHEVPDAVLVGGTAVALLAQHRYSTDADHVVVDLEDRYDQVRQHLESLAGWTTARTYKPVLLFGSLDGQDAGVRQLRHPVPLATQVIVYAGEQLCVPTYDEMLRIKAFLVLDRNYTRDYVDLLALAAPLEPERIKAALAPLDALYRPLAGEYRSEHGLLHDLGSALKKAEPKKPLAGDWHHFDAMVPDRQPWDLARIRHTGQQLGDRILTLWARLNDDRREADAPDASDAPEAQPPRERRQGGVY